MKKEAFWLATFEIRHSMKHSLLQFFVLLCFSSFILFSFPIYLEKRGFIGVDVGFLIIFAFVFSWIKRKNMQIQKVEGDLHASPFFLYLAQLPIKREILFQSRILVFLFYAIPFHLLILLFLYIGSSGIREALLLTNYFVFSLIWITYGISFGLSLPALEVGDNISQFKTTISIILILIFMFFGLTAFNLFYGDGLVKFTIMLANEYPLLMAILSIAYLVFSYFYWKRYMLKKMKTIDYLK